MSLLSRIRKFFSKKEQDSPNVDASLLELMPNPLIPWEIYPDADPDTFTCLQGNESAWLCEIWYPYWESLTENEKREFKKRAPTESWREWLNWRSEGAKMERLYRENQGIAFDYRTYLEDFKISYVHDVLEKKN
ncbi:MAG: hypothetical protein K2O70_06655 [Desulfovibrionaceae bacterium]|nr:hypothetical protein [Desulfovibrionaceae bacterium]